MLCLNFVRISNASLIQQLFSLLRTDCIFMLLEIRKLETESSSAYFIAASTYHFACISFCQTAESPCCWMNQASQIALTALMQKYLYKKHSKNNTMISVTQYNLVYLKSELAVNQDILDWGQMWLLPTGLLLFIYLFI